MTKLWIMFHLLNNGALIDTGHRYKTKLECVNAITHAQIFPVQSLMNSDSFLHCGRIQEK